MSSLSSFFQKNAKNVKAKIVVKDEETGASYNTACNVIVNNVVEAAEAVRLAAEEGGLAFVEWKFRRKLENGRSQPGTADLSLDKADSFILGNVEEDDSDAAPDSRKASRGSKKARGGIDPALAGNGTEASGS